MNFAAGRVDPILKRLLCDASCFSKEDFKEIMRRWWSFERIFLNPSSLDIRIRFGFDLDSGSLHSKKGFLL